MSRIVKLGYEIQVTGGDDWHPQTPALIMVGDDVAASVNRFLQDIEGRRVGEGEDETVIAKGRYLSVEPITCVDWIDPTIAVGGINPAIEAEHLLGEIPEGQHAFELEATGSAGDGAPDAQDDIVVEQ